MATWSSSAPTLPSGSSWGNTETASYTENSWKMTLTMKSARGIGTTYYIRIQAKFEKGSEGTYYPPDSVYFFADGNYKAYTPPDVGVTLTRYYTGTSSTAQTQSGGSTVAGVSKYSGRYSSGIAAYDTVSFPAGIYYGMIYDPNGGSGPSPGGALVLSGQKYTVGANTFTRQGYEFTTWNTKSDGSGTSYAPGKTFTPSGGMTFCAQWVKANIPVYVNVNGVIHQVEKAYVNVGGTIKEATVYANVNGTIKTLI